LVKEVGVRTSYEADVVAWASEQARLLRAGHFELLGRDRLAEETEDVGKGEQRELAIRISVLLAQLPKLEKLIALPPTLPIAVI
jgi:hypothetical protein